jgi:hypothetical protein
MTSATSSLSPWAEKALVGVLVVCLGLLGWFGNRTINGLEGEIARVDRELKGELGSLEAKIQAAELLVNRSSAATADVSRWLSAIRTVNNPSGEQALLKYLCAYYQGSAENDGQCHAPVALAVTDFLERRRREGGEEP